MVYVNKLNYNSNKIRIIVPWLIKFSHIVQISDKIHVVVQKILSSFQSLSTSPSWHET